MSRKPALGRRLVLSLFMAILIYGGMVMLARSVRELMESRESIAWPTVTGKVTRSDLKVNTQDVRRRMSNGIHRTSTEEYYEALIEYEFVIDGVTHKGHRRSAVQGGNPADKSHVQKTLAKYPVSQRVMVSYNPSDPSQCVLEPGSWGGFFVWAGLSLFLILLPGLVVGIAWHPRYHKVISGL